MQRLDEKTPIPLGLAILAIGGAGFWLASMYSQVQATTSAVQKMETTLTVLAEMKTDIAVIKNDIQLMKQPIRSTAINVKSIKRESLAACAFPPVSYSMTESDHN